MKWIFQRRLTRRLLFSVSNFRSRPGRRSVLPIATGFCPASRPFRLPPVRHHHGACSEQAGRQDGGGAERRTGGRPFHPVDSNDRDRSPANHVWLGWNEYHIHTSERAPSERTTYCSRNSHRDCSRTTHRFQSWLRERPFVQSSEMDVSLIAPGEPRQNCRRTNPGSVGSLPTFPPAFLPCPGSQVSRVAGFTHHFARGREPVSGVASHGSPLSLPLWSSCL